MPGCIYISTLKQIFALCKKRLFVILFLMILGALVAVCCGMVQLLWPQRAEDVPQVPLHQASDNMWSLREQDQEVNILINEIACLAAEINLMEKEAQQMREAMSAAEKQAAGFVESKTKDTKQVTEANAGRVNAAC